MHCFSQIIIIDPKSNKEETPDAFFLDKISNIFIYFQVISAFVLIIAARAQNSPMKVR